MNIYLIFGIAFEQRLLEKIEKISEEDFVDILIVLKEQKILKENFKDATYNVNYLKNHHFAIQSNLVRFLKTLNIEYIKQFWVINAVYVRIKVKDLEKLKNIDEIDKIYYAKDNFQIISDFKKESKILLDTPTYGIKLIKADSVWINYNIKGRGVIIGSIDTGVDTSHPALSGKILSYWLDAVNYQNYPYDDNNHGTHTIGTMVADSNVGVAPGAKVISCKAFNKYGSGDSYSILSCIQFFAELKAFYGVDIRIINNSWGKFPGNDPWLWNAIWNGWRANGIIPVFAVGNKGPNSNTIYSPGDYPIVIGVGAVNFDDTVVNFSSRGPAPSTSPYNNTTYWSRPDWNYIKPDIMAPGYKIYSTIRNGLYADGYGTSMASPHVAGVIALMLEKNPDLDYYQVYQILTDIANDRNCNEVFWPNNNCGWGRINALKAIESISYGNSSYLVFIDKYVYDKNANGKIESNETVFVDIKIRNIGYDTLKNVFAKLSTNSNSINFIKDSIYFGNLPPQYDINAFSIGDTFKFYTTIVNDGDSAIFNLNISGKNYKFKLILGEIPIGTATIDTTMGSLSFSNNGELKEFHFPKDSSNLLYFGSISLGNSENYLSDNFYGSKDIYNVYGIYKVLDYLDQNYKFKASDSKVEVEGNFYGKQADSIIYLVYKIKNISNEQINNLLFGIFADFDIKNPSNDFGWALRCSNSYGGIVLKSDDYSYFVGLFLISGIFKTARIFQNNIQFTKSNKFSLLNGTLGDSINLNPNDYSVVVSAGPYNLNPNDSLNLVYMIFASADSIKCKFTKLSEFEYFIRNKKLILRLNLKTASEVEYKIYDITGRVISNHKDYISNKFYELEINNLKTGIYIVQLKIGDNKRVFKVLFK
ncbi:MAG: S8 family serine peptidase [candidate division WOR-3 bacterium]